MTIRLVTSLVFSIFVNVAVCGQNLSKDELKVLLDAVAGDERAVAACEKARVKEEIRQFGKPQRKVAGHCWDSCPTLMRKPGYPESARRNRIRGQVTVLAIVDETGRVVYAKMVKGNRIFSQNALAAAYASIYQPKVTCDDRPIKFWWRINYNFRPDM